jgi:hypothetical protein
MSWKSERDALIAETLAFVQSVTGKRQETNRREVDRPDIGPAAPAEREVGSKPIPFPAAPVETKRVEAPPSMPPQSGSASRPFTPGEMAAEIRARVATFRAHQERFTREREEYFATTLAKLRAAIKDVPPPDK